MWVEGRLFSRGYIVQSRDWFNNRHDELRPAASFLLLYPWERTVACGLKPYLGRPGYPLSPLHTLVPHPTRRICHASACATYCLTLQVTSRRKQSCNIACVHVWRKNKHWVKHISIIVSDSVVVCSYTRRWFSVWLWRHGHENAYMLVYMYTYLQLSVLLQLYVHRANLPVSLSLFWINK